MIDAKTFRKAIQKFSLDGTRSATIPLPEEHVPKRSQGPQTTIVAVAENVTEFAHSSFQEGSGIAQAALPEERNPYLSH